MRLRANGIVFFGIAALVGAVMACTASAIIPPTEPRLPRPDVTATAVVATMEPPVQATEQTSEIVRPEVTPTVATIAVPSPSSTISPPKEITVYPTQGALPTQTLPATGTVSSRTETMFGPLNCESTTGDVRLTSHIYPPDQFDVLVPMGRMWDSHVTPTDHLYVEVNQERERGSVMSPADGQVISVGRFQNDQSPRWDSSQIEPDNRIVVAHSCNLFSIFIHLGELAPALSSVIGDLAPGERWQAGPENTIEVSAGDPIALFGGSTIDYSLHDENVTLPGFQVPEHYEGESWKVHTVDPFDYLADELIDDLLAKNERTVAPFGGQIDYDVQGTLAGNWFMDGTIDYRGNGTSFEYWNGHLAIAYDHIDPSQIRISIGRDIGLTHDDCRACGGVYAVSGNAPDPSSVTAADGFVKYELTGRQSSSPDSNGMTESNGILLGTFVVQVLDDASIKMEFFVGYEASEISGFTAGAVIYRR